MSSLSQISQQVSDPAKVMSFNLSAINQEALRSAASSLTQVSKHSAFKENQEESKIHCQAKVEAPFSERSLRSDDAKNISQVVKSSESTLNQPRDEMHAEMATPNQRTTSSEKIAAQQISTFSLQGQMLLNGNLD